ILIAAVIAAGAAIGFLAFELFQEPGTVTVTTTITQTPKPDHFVVEDPDGDRIPFEVNPSRRETIAALFEMLETGESRWVGGEIERFQGFPHFTFRFKPDTIVVANEEGLPPEEARATRYEVIQQDFEYWQASGTIYILGKVVGISVHQP
ncbi:MAG: hypothetical protein OEY99_06440, partial [Aigarchaeota archaeon]|nr:hypothetical protein [Aigarchaeota archaeon]